MNTAATVASLVRTCRSCPKKFVPPAAAPKATACRACHLVARKREQERQRALAAVAQRDKSRKELEAMLKDMTLSNALPKGAKKVMNGKQVAVSWQGISVTFHVAA